MSDGAGLVRSSAVVGVGTALSRVTGLLRIGAITYALGTVASADAYNLANTTPNIVYELILGGILSATLVPVFVERFETSDDEGISAVVTVAAVALVALTVAAIAAAPAIFRIYTLRKSAVDARELASVGVPLARLFLPQILFYGLTALATALLNARRRFAAPAMAPVLNNIVVCVALVLFARTAGRAPSLDEVRDDSALLWLLGLGTTGGIVAMTVVLWWPLRRAGVRLHWRFRPRDPAVRKVSSLAGWTVGYVVANQVALAVVLALAARRTGDASAYTYAFVFFQLPHGLFAVSLMTTFVPELSSLASRADWVAYRARFALGLRWLLLVVVPAAVGYVVLARPLVTALLARGSLTQSSAALVADILAALAIGLPGFSVYLFALRGFYAVQDTRTPFFLNALGERIERGAGRCARGVVARAGPGAGVRRGVHRGGGGGGGGARPAGRRVRRPGAGGQRAAGRRGGRRDGVRGVGRHVGGRLVVGRGGRRAGGGRRRGGSPRVRRSVAGARRGGVAVPVGTTGPAARRVTPMIKLMRRWWRYLTAKLTGKFNESADPKVQLEQAIIEAQEQHRRLVEQAANVIANQKQTEMRLNRALEDLEKVTTNARQAVLMADEATKKGDTAKATEYTNAAEAFANRLIALEREIDSLKALHLQATQASDQAKSAVQQNSRALQQKLSERQKLLGQLDQAKMQEQMNKAMASLSETVGQDVPSLEEVREKIEARYAKARGMSELTGSSVEARMLEVEQASMNSEAQTRLAEIRSQLGLAPAEEATAAVGPGEPAVATAGGEGAATPAPEPAAQPEQ